MVRLELEEAGLSRMQELESEMAADKGVPVVTVRFSGRSTEKMVKAQLEKKGATAELKAGIVQGV